MDILATLCDLTDDKTWYHVNGPDSGTGVDYWFENDAKSSAYANNDQGFIVISVDGENIFEGGE